MFFCWSGIWRICLSSKNGKIPTGLLKGGLCFVHCMDHALFHPSKVSIICSMHILLDFTISNVISFWCSAETACSRKWLVTRFYQAAESLLCGGWCIWITWRGCVWEWVGVTGFLTIKWGLTSHCTICTPFFTCIVEHHDVENVPMFFHWVLLYKTTLIVSARSSQ